MASLRIQTCPCKEKRAYAKIFDILKHTADQPGFINFDRKLTLRIFKWEVLKSADFTAGERKGPGAVSPNIPVHPFSAHKTPGGGQRSSGPQSWSHSHTGTTVVQAPGVWRSQINRILETKDTDVHVQSAQGAQCGRTHSDCRPAAEAFLKPHAASPLGLAPPARGRPFDLKFFCTTFGKRMAASLPWHSLLSQEQARTGLVQRRLSAVSLMKSEPSKHPRESFRTDNGLLSF